MSISKTLTSTVVALSVAAGSLAPLSSTATAGEWGGKHRQNYGDDYPDFDGHRSYRRYNENQWYKDWRQRRDYDRRAHGPRHAHPPVVVYKKEKDRSGRNMAIAIGAIMLGAIIASEASRHNHR